MTPSTSASYFPTSRPASPPVAESETAIRVDVSRFPLVSIELSPNPTLADHRAMYDACNALAAKGGRFGYVVDMRKANPFSFDASARTQIAEMYREGLEVRRAVTVCEARVIEHPVIRGIVVAFDGVVGHNWPTATFASVELAEEWVMAKLRADLTRRSPRPAPPARRGSAGSVA